jgi:cytochrome c peroxidase
MARSHYARTAGATAAIAILSILTASTSPVRGNSSTAGGVLGQSLPNLLPLPNAAGYVATQTADGRPIDLTGPFFQSLGANQRSCASCHRPAQGWTISAEEVKARFEATQGLDPIFRRNDGSNCDQQIDVSTVGGRRQAYSLLINKGLIRVALQTPTNAEFNVIAVANPYGCGDSSTLSVYRRPLPSANLRFLSTLMWDGRESAVETGTHPITYGTNPLDLFSNLRHQAISATDGHAQAIKTLTVEQQQAIVDFQMNLSVAQIIDNKAGPLYGDGGKGGPVELGTATTAGFFIGINDPLGLNPKAIPFSPVVFNLFDAWANWTKQQAPGNDQGKHRASILRGQTLFNSKPIDIRGVAGLNDDLNVASIPGTCGTCHDSPNVGNHSVSAPLDIGVSDINGFLPLSYLPVITLQNKKTHEIRTTTDPGRALITGKWKDVGRLKGPTLRALASRAPYFHNGGAATLADVVDFYDKRFSIGLTPQEKTDMVAFLNAL